MSRANYEAVLSYKGHQVKAFGHWSSDHPGSPVLSQISVRIANKVTTINGPWETHDHAVAAILQTAEILIDG